DQSAPPRRAPPMQLRIASLFLITAASTGTLAGCSDSLDREPVGGSEATLCLGTAADQVECSRRRRDTGAADAVHDAPDASVDATAAEGGAQVIRYVWIVLMENHNFSDMLGSSSAPYINGTLLRTGAFARNYQN